ncbi:hypothetical protein [Clostridium perfringens]|uniref:hypothetical protein n=1 Tax=Clostridium perfringens TaxID=1502 RepID=UPI0018E412B0|nr:hypothetical protein [Clostridium perfringens]
MWLFHGHLKTLYSVLDEIPNNVSEFQINKLLALQKRKPELFNDEMLDSLTLDTNSNKNKLKINQIFNDIYENAYENHYKRIETDLDLVQYRYIYRSPKITSRYIYQESTKTFYKKFL